MIFFVDSLVLKSVYFCPVKHAKLTGLVIDGGRPGVRMKKKNNVFTSFYIKR